MKKQAKTGYRKAVSARSAKRVTQQNLAFAVLGMEFSLQGAGFSVDFGLHRAGMEFGLQRAEITKFGLLGAGWMHAVTPELCFRQSAMKMPSY